MSVQWVRFLPPASLIPLRFGCHSGSNGAVKQYSRILVQYPNQQEAEDALRETCTAPPLLTLLLRKKLLMV